MTTWNKIFADNFQRANSGTIGNSWVQPGGSPFSISNDVLSAAGAPNPTATGNYLIRPVTSIPATVITNTNEGSINQRVVVTVANMNAAEGLCILLRTNTAMNKGYAFYTTGNYAEWGTVIGGGNVTNYSPQSGSITFPSAPDPNLVNQPCTIDYSAVSTDATHTTVSVIITHVFSGTVIYSGSYTDSTATLQGGDCGTVTCGITGSSQSGAANPWTITGFTSYTDQPVQIASAMTPGAIGSPSVAENSVALSASATTGGTGTLAYQWYRSRTAPSGGSYGKPLLGQTSLSLHDLGLNCATQFWYTLATTDQTTSNAQTAYSTTVTATTSAAVESNNPGKRASLLMWADADALVGQANGSALAGPFGQFTDGAKSSSVLPSFSSGSIQNGKNALTFAGASGLTIEPGADLELANLFANGSFTATIVFNIANGNTAGAILANMNAGSVGVGNTAIGLISGTVTTGGLANATGVSNWGDSTGFTQGYGSSNQIGAFPTISPNTSNGVATIVSTVNIIQLSYNASTGMMTYGNTNGTFLQYPYSTQKYAYNSPLNIGACADAGAAFSPLYELKGQISQVLIDNIALTQAQMISDQAYFRTRYGFANQGKYILSCHGDSRTYGVDSSGYPGAAGGTFTTSAGQTIVSGGTVNAWPFQLQALLPNNSNVLVFNHGVAATGSGSFILGQPSYTSAVGANVLTDDVTKPRIIVVLFGVNDWIFASGTEAAALAACKANLNATISGILSLNTITGGQPVNLIAKQFAFDVVYGTEIDTQYAGGVDTTGQVGWDTFRSGLNAYLKSTFPPSTYINYADLATNSLVGIDGSSSNPVYWGSDTLHPIGENSSGVPGGGYAVIAGLFAPVVGTFFPHSGLFNHIYFSGGFHGPYGGGYSS